jgi:hypothetical protein
VSNLVNINVSVPEEHVADVYAYVASLINGTATPAGAAKEGSETPPPKAAKRAPSGFGSATVRKNYLGGKSDYWRPFLEVLADHPDEWVEWSELCKAIGLSNQQTAGMLGAAERRCKLKPPYWKAYEEGTYWFQMPTAVADIVRDLANDEG